MRYKVEREGGDAYYIYKRILFWWRVVSYKPSFSLCKRWLLEHGCKTFIYIDNE